MNLNPNRLRSLQGLLLAACCFHLGTPFLSRHPGVFFSSRRPTTFSSSNLHVSLSTTWFTPSAGSTAAASTATTTAAPSTAPTIIENAALSSSGAFAFQDFEQHAVPFRDAASSAFWVPSSRTTTTTTRARSATKTQQFRLYCDLDGVLCDFESGIRSLFPEHSFLDGISSFHIPDLDRSTMWKRIQNSQQPFFETLPWTAGGPRLWKAIAHLQPDILTGVPTYRQSRLEKLKWCHRELGVQVQHIDMAGHWRSHMHVDGVSFRNRRKRQQQPDVCHVITCWSDNKHFESGQNAILIDDRECLREKWEAKGGIFVHHDGNVDATIATLRAIGVDVKDEYDDDDNEWTMLLP